MLCFTCPHNQLGTAQSGRIRKTNKETERGYKFFTSESTSVSIQP